MSTAGTNITALAKPAVGVTVGPTWATDLNTSIDAVDNHDHSTNKGVRITPAAINVNSAFEYNSNDITELKTLSFDTATASTTNYSIYQNGGNLYWRNGSGTAVQITTGSTVNAGAGSIDGMTGNDSGVTFVDGAKAFNFFCDSGNTDFGKMAHADLLLYKFDDNNVADTDYITLAASALASGSSGTVTLPAETGTILTNNTSFAGAAINLATTSGHYPIILNPNGTGHVVIGNAGATGKLTSNGAYDLVLDTNAGTNSGTITIIDAANGNIDITPNGSGEVNLSKVDIDAGAIDGTIIGAASAAAGTFAALVGTSLDVSGAVFANNNLTVAASTALNGNVSIGNAVEDVITVYGTTSLAAGANLETSTTGKIKQKGAFLQNSFHQSLALCY